MIRERGGAFMGNTYVSCHGGLASNLPSTFVPGYIRAIEYYAFEGEKLGQVNELGIVAREGTDLGELCDRYRPGDEIPNYQLSPGDDTDAAMVSFFEKRPGSVYVLQEGTFLCAGDGVDQEGTPHACDPDERVHYCTGLLGRIAWADTELQDVIVMLNCRLIAGQPAGHASAIGSDDRDTYVYDALEDFVEQWESTDDIGKAAIWDDPGLPEGTKITMLGYTSIADWVFTRQARWLAASDGDLALYAYYWSPQQAPYRGAFLQDPDVAAAYYRAELAQIAALRQAEELDRFTLWLELTSEQQDSLLLAAPDIRDLVGA
jgi:hypothetical protein